MRTSIHAMLKESLLQLLKGGQVSDKKEVLGLANTATFATEAASELLVQPKDKEELARVLGFANSRHLPVYVTSRGKNWGFGSRVPVHECVLLLDLSLMNRIVAYDEEFGTLRVEPGVTFAQASEFLAAKGNRHFLNTIGGSPEASVLGNALERGDGAGPQCERSELCCSLEVMLVDGSRVHLGFGNVATSRVKDLCKHGIGPNFQELFAQSNLGIVTELTVWLNRVPSEFRTFAFHIDDDEHLGPVLEALKELYERSVLSSPVTFWNDYKRAVISSQYPWKAMDEKTPLDRDSLQKLSNDYSRWVAFGGVYVDHSGIARLTVKELVKSLRPYTRKPSFLSQLSDRKVRILRSVNNLLGGRLLDLSGLLEQWERNVLLGRPSEVGIRGQYWRKRSPIPSDINPERDLCGVLWNAFVMPLRGELVSTLMQRVEKSIFAYRFEPIISLTVVNQRYIRVFQQLVFDREIAGEDSRALACHTELFELIEEAGCSHSRLDTLQMLKMGRWLRGPSLHQRIKRALDPNQILSPGRYSF